VLAASEEAALAYRRTGLDSLEIGDEALVDVESFSLQGRSMRPVRQAANRARRGGCVARVDRQGALNEVALAEVREAAAAWRGEAVERGFSMALGRIGSPGDEDGVLVRCRDGRGGLVCVLTLVPWGRDGLSLDLMRRRSDSENGVVELCVAELLAAAAGLGVRRVSLNFVVFDRGARIGAGPVLRLWRRVLLLASRRWQMESLYRACAKYSPAWQPRFLCFRRGAELPRVGLAALEAEGFFASPRWRWLGR
jgi:lysyl-tRNA synthetase class 2